MMKKYIYGMRLRGCSIGTQPNGFEIIENTIEDKYYDLLAYGRVLTDEELKEYELDYIGVMGYGETD